ncbi:MAG: hypothetical protein HY758_08855 [Nitrospirae bacterium]|nr:hypothetical protein [Nitrospirota bacterium]
MKKLVPPLIILLWIIAMSALLLRHMPGSHLDIIKAQSVLPDKKQRWMGIYLKGQKIGYASNSLTRETEGYSVAVEMHMKLNVMGAIQEVHTRASASLAPDLKIRSFRFALKAAQDMEVEGKIRDKTLSLTIKTANDLSSKEIKLHEAPQMNLSIIPYLINKGLKKGTRLTFPVFDPVTLGTQKMTVEVMGKEQITLNKNKAAGPEDAFKIKGEINGMTLWMWIDEQGNELKEESPAGFTLISEPMSEAVKFAPPSGSSDIILQTSVPFNLDLPPDISYLKVRLKGLDTDGFELDGGRQTLKGDVLEIKKDAISSLGNNILPPAEAEQYLEETPFIQSGNKDIIDLAKKITGTEKAPLSKGLLLWEWTFKNIEKVPSITIPSALEVLKTRKGDCNEHTTLFTALARAAGLPAKMSAGLVYKDKRFYYHAWPEIFAGRWIAIDPTLGQFPADAAHIRLISGGLDRQAILIRAINNISIEGIEYR